MNARPDMPKHDTRPGLAIVSAAPRPDRVHFHERLADEIPEISIHSIFTRSVADIEWTFDLPEKIHPLNVAIGNDVGFRGWGNPWKDWKKTGRIARYCLEHNVRAVVFNGYASLTAVLLQRWCRMNTIPTFIRSDSNIKVDLPRSALHGWLKRKLVTWFVRRCDGVMPMGDLGLQYYQRYGAVAERCFWSPSVPDYRMFENVPPERVATFRARHGLAPDRRQIFYCGRLIPVKRVDLLVDAFARLAAERPEWDLLLAGSGPLDAELKARVPRELADRVKWLGFMEWAELPPAYAASDVFVLPSTKEAWAVVIIEAMQVGLVPVASDIVQAAYELYDHGDAGLRFESGSVDSLAQCLLDVTDETNFQRYRQRVPQSLEGWKTRRDPVEWMRRALRFVDVLPEG